MARESVRDARRSLLTSPWTSLPRRKCFDNSDQEKIHELLDDIIIDVESASFRRFEAFFSVVSVRFVMFA